jgi:hypothetical protein
MLMSELQYQSPGRCIYYWFGDAYGIIQSGTNAGNLVYLGSEAEVKESLRSELHLSSSKPAKTNEILANERSRSGGQL